MSKFIVKNIHGTFVLEMDDILYMEKALRKIKVHLESSCVEAKKYDTDKDCIEFYGKMEDVMRRLDERFLYCHRSYIINMDKVVVMTDNTIYLEDRADIYMGKETFARASRGVKEYFEKKL